MVWDWLAPTATAAVAVAGIVGNVLIARGGRIHAQTMADKSFNHGQTVAREQRQQQRLADTYIGLLTMAEKVGAWCALVRPMMDTIPPRPLPDLPSREEQHRVEALVQAYGSDEVLSLMKAWRDVVRSILQAHEFLDFLGAANDHRDEALKSRLEITNRRPEEREARRLLQEAVRRELAK